MFSEPSFRVLSRKSESEKIAFKVTKKFLKLQETLSLEVDSQKKIAAVSEDVLANLHIVVEAMQADAKDYAERFGIPAPPAVHIDSDLVVVDSEEGKKAKKRKHSQTEPNEPADVDAVAIKEEGGAESVEKKKSKKKKKSADE